MFALGGVWISGHGSHLLLASCAIAVAWCRELARAWHKDQRLRRIERMPMPSPYQIALSCDEQAVLTTRARSVRGSYRDRLRAAIVLAAAAGQGTAIAMFNASSPRELDEDIQGFMAEKIQSPEEGTLPCDHARAGACLTRRLAGPLATGG